MASRFKILDAMTADGRVQLRVDGRLDAHGVCQLVERCAEVREAGQGLDLHLARVSHIASCGVGGLLVILESFRQAHLELRLLDVSAPVQAVLQLLNIEDLPIATTPPDADRWVA